jgi:hypothetical protein
MAFLLEPDLAARMPTPPDSVKSSQRSEGA